MVTQKNNREPRINGKSLLSRRRRRQTLLTMALGAVILLSGTAIGTVAAMALLKDTSTPALVESPTPPDRAAVAIAGDIARRYHLDQDGTDKVRRIMAERLKAIGAIRRQMHERIVAEHEKLRAEMKEALTPEQYGRWQERFEAVRRRARFGRPHRRRGPGRGPHWRGGHRSGQGFPGDPFKHFDKDNDGALTSGELEQVPEPLRRRLMSADADGDGVVTKQEFMKHLRDRRLGDTTPRSGASLRSTSRPQMPGHRRGDFPARGPKRPPEHR